MDIENQIELEKLHAKNLLIPRLRGVFIDAGFDKTLEAQGFPVDLGIDILVQIYMHKRAGVSTMVGSLMHHFDGDAQTTADALHVAVTLGLLTWDPVSLKFILIYELTQEVEAELQEFQYPLPLVVPPKPLTGPRSTGYYVIPGSVLLGDASPEDQGDYCLEFLDDINANLCFTINTDVVRMVKNEWRALDKPKEDEPYEKYQDRVKAFNHYDQVSRDVIDRLVMMNDGTLWFTHAYDYRGRVYPRGYHANYQGNQWNKAVLEMAEPELVI